MISIIPRFCQPFNPARRLTFSDFPVILTLSSFVDSANGGIRNEAYSCFLAAALTAFSVAQAESDTDSTFVFGPADTETAAPKVTPSPTPIPLLEDNGDSSFDFSQVDNPLATPVAIDPIDKPTPTPAPTPNYAYETYTNDMMAISFDIPYTWLLNPATNQETTIQFVEPKSERMDVDGYQTRLTVERFSAGLTQTASDAKHGLKPC